MDKQPTVKEEEQQKNRARRLPCPNAMCVRAAAILCEDFVTDLRRKVTSLITFPYGFGSFSRSASGPFRMNM